jgi:hypothetical protein
MFPPKEPYISATEFFSQNLQKLVLTCGRVRVKLLENLETNFFPQKIGPQFLLQIGLHMRTRARVNFSAKKPYISPKKVSGKDTNF